MSNSTSLHTGFNKWRAAGRGRSSPGDVIGGAVRGGAGDVTVAAHGPAAARRVPRGAVRLGRRARLPHETASYYAQVSTIHRKKYGLKKKTFWGRFTLSDVKPTSLSKYLKYWNTISTYIKHIA